MNNIYNTYLEYKLNTIQESYTIQEINNYKREIAKKERIEKWKELERQKEEMEKLEKRLKQESEVLIYE